VSIRKLPGKATDTRSSTEPPRPFVGHAARRALQASLDPARHQTDSEIVICQSLPTRGSEGAVQHVADGESVSVCHLTDIASHPSSASESDTTITIFTGLQGAGPAPSHSSSSAIIHPAAIVASSNADVADDERSAVCGEPFLGFALGVTTL
jgi:hypothetical protein